MHQGKYVFAQLTSFLPARVFDRCVEKYGGNKWVKHFSCWNQMLCMIFGQLSGRDSLRDLMVTVGAHSAKYYHLGLGRNVSRSNLANANERRDYRIYEAFAYEMVAEARACIVPDGDFTLPITDNVYALDSTTVDLCLAVFWWAAFRRAKGAVKLHTLYDIRSAVPAFVLVTPGSVHDVNAMDSLAYEAGGYYIMDRGYVDFERLFRIHTCGAFFVTRPKDNLAFRRVYSAKADKGKGVLCDQAVRLTGPKTGQRYPRMLRRIKYRDEELGRTFVFLTNNTELAAADIAQLYKYRWKIELFFKWVKQHLKIKSFWGTSLNAVKTQVYIAMTAFILVAIVRSKLKSELSTYEVLQILSVSLLDKTPVNQLLAKPIYQDDKEHNPKQLKINLI